MPEPYTTNIALYFIFNAIDNDNNALALFMLLITASQSITFTLYIRDRLACLFIKTAVISPADFLVVQTKIEVYRTALVPNLFCPAKHKQGRG